MKKLILLGILLLAGLSFARTPMNWMQSVEGRYYCDWIYNGQNLYDYSTGPLGATPQQLSQMSNYLYGNGIPGMAGELYDMYYAAECPPSEGTDPVEFRQSLLAYNMNAAGFKSVFLQVLRNCIIAHPAERTHIMEEMASFRAGYTGCLPGTFCKIPPR